MQEREAGIKQVYEYADGFQATSKAVKVTAGLMLWDRRRGVCERMIREGFLVR